MNKNNKISKSRDIISGNQIMYSHVIKIDKQIYSKEVLLRTAYSYLDKVYIHLHQDNAYWIVEWKEKKNEGIDPQNFENRLIEQQLRVQLLEKNAEIRKIILARAFASTILDPGTINEEDRCDVSDNQINEENNYDEEEILRGWYDHEDRI